MKRMSSSVMNVSRGDQPKHCDSQWLRLTPRRISKPDGLAVGEATRGAAAASAAGRQRSATASFPVMLGIIPQGSADASCAPTPRPSDALGEADDRAL